MKPRSLLPLAIFALALTAAAWRIPNPAPAAFVAPPPPAAATAPAEFASTLLPVAAPSAHAAALAELPDGRLAAAWFAGSREGAADVAVWLSLRDGEHWTTPHPIATREATAQATLAYTRKVGNPVLFVEGQRLHLWFVSVSWGGWAGSSLNHAHSDDAGATWSSPRKLQTSPFFNISTLGRAPPVHLADGGIGLPVYHEFIAKHGEWLRLDASGALVGKTRMPQPVRTLQPAVVALDGQRAFAALRDAGPGPGRVRVAVTDDAGQHWQRSAPLPLPNPNASVALLRLASGHLLLAGNGEGNRNRLLLWLSADEGRTWSAPRAIEDDPEISAEYSYPALLLARDGRIHLAYTWQRKGIRHAVFTEAWLNTLPGAQP